MAERRAEDPSGIDRLDAVLADAVRLGFLSDRPPQVHRQHARAFVPLVARSKGHIVDLGTGGGVPGLILAVDVAPRQVVCVERRQRRAAFLRMAAARLGLENVVVEAIDVATVIAQRRWTSAGAVTARSFGPPTVTLPVAAALLSPGGLLVVSEPPGEEEGRRWAGASEYGLVLVEVVPGPPTLAVLERR